MKQEFDKYVFSFNIRGLYKNIKNGNIYILLNENVISTTNKFDGKRMCLYTDKNFEHVFIREYEEFCKKFIKISSENC